MNLVKTEDAQDYRLILYPASRSFKTLEIKEISERLFDFLSTWNAHGKALKSSFKIEYNQFIIFCVDENQEVASGCSIDRLGHLMKELDSEYQLGLFDRMKACILIENEVRTYPLNEFKKQLKQGSFSAQNGVFDFSVETYRNYLKHFLKPISESWATRYL